MVNEFVYPLKLEAGDTVAVIAPSRSLSIVSKENIDFACKRFEFLGLDIRFGQHVYEIDDFNSSSIKSRILDLHNAFLDTEVKAIFTAIGGFNSNQLLKYIDYNIIACNPKILCGYSDITALQNAIFSKTGLVTYSGPHFSSFAQQFNFDYTLEYLKKILFKDSAIDVLSSHVWSDDAWYLDQKNITYFDNQGFLILNQGKASGNIIGGNLTTLQMLSGTDFFPSLYNSVLFLEDDYEQSSHHIERALQSLILRPDFKFVKGIVFGRFQKQSCITRKLLQQIIATKIDLQSIPIIAGVDFGHTSPMITFPIGGKVEIEAFQDKVKISIVKH